MTNERIYIPLLGGLGNQLFQYFAGELLEVTLNREVVYETSHSSLRRNIKNEAVIRDLKFTSEARFEDLELDTLSRKLLSFSIRSSTGDTFSKKVQREITKKISKVIPSATSSIRRIGIADDLGFTDTSKFHDKNIVVGYFQTYLFFRQLISLTSEVDWRNKISSSMKSADVNRIFSRESGTLIHVRRGDYVGGKFGLLSENYYLRSIQKIYESNGAGSIIVISDGSEVDMKLLPKRVRENAKYVNTKDFSAVEILSYMTTFENIVLANSSLSWWGATFGQLLGVTKTVIAPSPWFQDTSPPREMFPINWLKVEGDIWES